MRIAMMVLRNMFFVPALFIKLLWLSHHYNGDYYPGFMQCKKISAHAIKGGNITAEIHNVENLPEEDGFILY
ncbi:MAG: 1-acyl-sn-glycerol-3-phosphate acyltransferase, partial [Lachnospiraceae bacterium]